MDERADRSKQERALRLKQALRDNLRRRKAQAREAGESSLEEDALPSPEPPLSSEA